MTSIAIPPTTKVSSLMSSIVTQPIIIPNPTVKNHSFINMPFNLSNSNRSKAARATAQMVLATRTSERRDGPVREEAPHLKGSEEGQGRGVEYEKLYTAKFRANPPPSLSSAYTEATCGQVRQLLPWGWLRRLGRTHLRDCTALRREAPTTEALVPWCTKPCAWWDGSLLAVGRLYGLCDCSSVRECLLVCVLLVWVACVYSVCVQGVWTMTTHILCLCLQGGALRTTFSMLF